MIWTMLSQKYTAVSFGFKLLHTPFGYDFRYFAGIHVLSPHLRLNSASRYHRSRNSRAIRQSAQRNFRILRLFPNRSDGRDKS